MTRDGPLVMALFAVAIGAVLGAWLRWALSYWLNPRIEHLPMGTLASNLIGGYLIGVAVAVFAAHPSVTPFWRLVIVTGFLGGLTTFSTFSAESVALMQGAQWASAVMHTAAHLGGSLLATVAGIATYRALA
jgi:CrcB protein